MIEKIILDHLSSELSVPVYLERPEHPEKEYVLLEKTGSSVRNHIYSATLAIQSIAPTLYGAASLNELVKAAMDKAIELDEITHSELNSDYNYTNPTSKTYRYQAVYDVVFYD
ncbi:MAG: hypothetical protein Q4P22_06710 [Eubacteriales bacterium]|nr:hypothetical protein [Eubacteriales bacterium]